jgi:hypothetical protein
MGRVSFPRAFHGKRQKTMPSLLSNTLNQTGLVIELARKGCRIGIEREAQDFHDAENADIR